MAEREGFEPPVQFPAQWFSRPPPSASRSSLQKYLLEYYNIKNNIRGEKIPPF